MTLFPKWCVYNNMYAQIMKPLSAAVCMDAQCVRRYNAVSVTL